MKCICNIEGSVKGNMWNKLGVRGIKHMWQEPENEPEGKSSRSDPEQLNKWLNLEDRRKDSKKVGLHAARRWPGVELSCKFQVGTIES